jgi:Protein of unknown function (DUF3667)
MLFQLTDIHYDQELNHQQMTTQTEIADSAIDEPAPAPPDALCGNCDAPLMGAFCHQCGQAVRSPVREFFGFIKDGSAELIRPNGKFFRTLAALYFRPGRLTTLYLHGQRSAFIKPIKLYFSLSVILFLLASLHPNSGVSIGNGNSSNASTERSAIHIQLDEDANSDSSGMNFNVDDKPWHPQNNPLNFDLAPAVLDRWINKKLSDIDAAAKASARDPQKIVSSLYRVLPSMMFVLLPIFALLLKLLYCFSNRLYAQHLLVAVQSHSFMFLSFIMLILLGDISLFGVALLTQGAHLLMVAIAAWIPIYLFWMQKQVYQQSWWLTLLKYSFAGFCYFMLLSFGLAIAIVAALANI